MQELSSFGRRVLKKMTTGVPAHSKTDGGASVGTLKVPASVFGLLKAKDLIVAESESRYRASDIAPHYLARTEGSGRRGRSPVAGGKARKNERFGGQHQRPTASQVEEGGRRRRIGKNLCESPLGRLVGRRGRDGRVLITQTQFEAGERLRCDFEWAGMAPGMTVRYDGLPVGSGRRTAPADHDPALAQIHAKRRFDAAIAAVGPGLADILIRVCCFHEAIDGVERALAWPSRSAKVVLAIALDRLVDHYDGKKRAPEGAQAARGDATR